MPHQNSISPQAVRPIGYRLAHHVRLLLCMVLCLAPFISPAQAPGHDTAKTIVAKPPVKKADAPKHKDEPHSITLHHMTDTLRFRRSIAIKKALVLSDSALNQIGIDSLLDKVEDVHNTLNQINNTTAIGWDTHDITSGLPDIDSNIDIIEQSISLYDRVLDVKNLQMFNVLLADLQDQLNDWRNTLFKYNKDLMDMGNQMNAFRRDTVLRALLADSAFRSLYNDEIIDLKSKWMTAKNAVANSKSSISQLQAQVSNQYFETIDLQNNIRILLRKISVKSMGMEYDYLWHLNSATIGDSKETSHLIRRSYAGQQKILRFYFYRNISNQLWMLVVGLLLFAWVAWNFVRLRKRETDEKHTKAFHYISPIPLVATFIVLFNIAPFFDLHPPTAYVEIMQMLLVISLTILLYRNWPRNLFRCWLAISILYISFAVMGTLFVPTLGFRLLLLALNVVSLVFSVFWFRAIRHHTFTFDRMIRFVTFIYVALNIIAVCCNLFGRLSLAKIFSVTAIYALTQIIGLSVFIRIIMESFQLQERVNKLGGGLLAKMDFEIIERFLHRALILVSVCIWFIIFTISLNLYNIIFDDLSILLTKPRKIGSTTFQVGNILLFLAIIYVSNVIQQGIGSLYGKTEDTTWDPEVRKNGSRLAMTRLVLIVIGFLIAVAASGLPLDKITIVLGALGVGIGLGLQTIVNNLVSGVVLIFEQPFRIGDYIEIGDKRGRVLDIGIRSSKMIMEEGAEMIVPNADLLGGRVINWTMRNDNVRIEMPISLEAGEVPFDEVKKIIVAAIEKNEHVIADMQPDVLLAGLKDKTMMVNVLVWINNVHTMQAIRSELLYLISNALTARGIHMS